MQKSNELLLSIAEKNNGVIRYSDVEEKDISKDAFFRFIKNNDFEKVSHGIYLSPDVFPDEMFLLQLRFPRIVFSNETALYLHNLSDMEPSPLSVTVLTGYNSANLEAMGIKITHCKAEFYEIGLSEILSNSGNVLRV
ncbi:MAG: type IV toxin-antitoxin system AbiEi family antitoxin domain-containing protein, partial [Clostridiales bacterium]|nr:type IV toxin-antitoxin system AbiEi family antitoxin domain-containing protein [Clostridiales bacterium]